MVLARGEPINVWSDEASVVAHAMKRDLMLVLWSKENRLGDEFILVMLPSGAIGWIMEGLVIGCWEAGTA